MQDLVRRIRNGDEFTGNQVVEEIVSEYNYSMWLGEHEEVFRHLVCVRALSSVRKAKKNERDGKGRMYRNKTEIEERWARVGGRPDRSSWFRKGGITGVVAVPSSDNERIKRKVESVISRIPGPLGQKLRVVERPGPSLWLMVMKNDPCPQPYCGRSNCAIGQDRECRNTCYRESIDYNVVCRRCYTGGTGVPPKIYIGETSRPIFTRIAKHISDMKGSLKKRGGNLSWMARHVVEDHAGAYDVGNPVSEWIVSIDGAHRKPLNRQVKESINIKKARGGVQLK